MKKRPWDKQFRLISGSFLFICMEYQTLDITGVTAVLMSGLTPDFPKMWRACWFWEPVFGRESRLALFEGEEGRGEWTDTVDVKGQTQFPCKGQNGLPTKTKEMNEDRDLEIKSIRLRRVFIRILCEPPKNAGYKADSFGCPPYAMP